MDEARQREIARKGGQAAHQKGKAHQFTTEEARQAGRKGGQSVSRDREHMSAIGRAGGRHSHLAQPPLDPPEQTETTPPTYNNLNDFANSTEARTTTSWSGS